MDATEMRHHLIKGPPHAPGGEHAVVGAARPLCRLEVVPVVEGAVRAANAPFRSPPAFVPPAEVRLGPTGDPRRGQQATEKRGAGSGRRTDQVRAIRTHRRVGPTSDTGRITIR